MSIVVKSDTKPTPHAQRIYGVHDHWVLDDEWDVALFIATLCTLPLTVHPQPRPIRLELTAVEWEHLYDAVTVYKRTSRLNPTKKNLESLQAHLRQALWT